MTMNILGYIGLMAAAAAAIALAARLFMRTQREFLRFITLAIVFSSLFAFLEIIGKFMTDEMLAYFNFPPLVFAVVNLSFRLLGLPFIILSWFYFIRAIRSMTGKPFRVEYRILYLLGQAGLLIVYAVLTWEALRGQPPSLSAPAESLLLAFSILNRGALFILWVLAYTEATRNRDMDMSAGIRLFSAAYLVVFVLFAAGALLIKGEAYACIAYPVFEFFIHLPPLVLLWAYLRKYLKSHPLEPFRESVWKNLFSRYQISSREQDIIRCLVDGKNRREIAEELFISVKTVKTHIYNIYRKVGVRNRWQLITLVQNYSRSLAAGI